MAKVFDPLAVKFPAVLDTEEFREAWPLWVAHRKRIGHPLTERIVKSNWTILTLMGVDEAVTSIHTSVCNGWRNLYPEYGKRSKEGPGGRIH